MSYLGIPNLKNLLIGKDVLFFCKLHIINVLDFF